MFQHSVTLAIQHDLLSCRSVVNYYQELGVSSAMDLLGISLLGFCVLELDIARPYKRKS